MSKSYDIDDRFTPKLKGQSTPEEVERILKKGEEARIWLMNNMGIEFPTLSEALKSGSCKPRSLSKAETA